MKPSLLMTALAVLSTNGANAMHLNKIVVAGTVKSYDQQQVNLLIEGQEFSFDRSLFPKDLILKANQAVRLEMNTPDSSKRNGK